MCNYAQRKYLYLLYVYIYNVQYEALRFVENFHYRVRDGNTDSSYIIYTYTTNTYIVTIIKVYNKMIGNSLLIPTNKFLNKKCTPDRAKPIKTLKSNARSINTILYIKV